MNKAYNNSKERLSKIQWNKIGDNRSNFSIREALEMECGIKEIDIDIENVCPFLKEIGRSSVESICKRYIE